MIVKPRSKTEGTIIIQNQIMNQIGIGSKLILTLPTRISYTQSNRTKYNSVKAFWQNPEKAKRTGEIAGEGSPQFEIKQTFETKAKAKQAASAKLEQLKRGTGDISVTCPGDPNIKAGMEMILIGFRPEVNGNYIVTSANHTMNGSGYINTISGEKKPE